MPGFASHDQIIQAQGNGQVFKATWGKNFNPTAAAVANEFHTLFRGAGNPGADALFNTGTNLFFQGITDQTANAASIQHGGNVQATYYKYLQSLTAVSAAGTVVPGILKLVDVIGFYRVTSVTTATAQATTNTLGFGDTFSADDTTDICNYTSTTNIPSNILTGTRVRLTTTTTLPAGLALATDYYVIRLSDTTFKLATTYANAVAGTAINITSTGTGTHTISRLLPRHTNGAGVQAIIFNSNATPLGAAVPNMSLGYTNSAQTASRATPTVLPIGKTAASNSHIIYTGAAATGKYNYTMPLQSGDAGIAEINTIQNSISYVSGEYTVALIKEITEIPLSTLGLAAERNLLTEMPSLPRIYDGAALYWVWGSGVATPASSSFSGTLNFCGTRMLTNNYSVLNSSPGRAIGGFTNLYSNYKPSSWYSFFAIDTLETASPVKRASLPSGTQPPYSWILAMKGGELSSTTGITGTGSMAPTMYISRDLASTMGGVGSISGSLSLLSQLSAALAGVGALQGSLSLGLSLSSNLSGTGALTPSLSLLVGMVASIGGSGAITANLTGIARLEASIFVNSGTASVQELVEGVWSAVAADNDTAGTMGEKLNDAGSAGNPWTDTTTYGAGTKGKLLQDAADDADTAANK